MGLDDTAHWSKDNVQQVSSLHQASLTCAAPHLIRYLTHKCPNLKIWSFIESQFYEPDLLDAILTELPMPLLACKMHFDVVMFTDIQSAISQVNRKFQQTEVECRVSIGFAKPDDEGADMTMTIENNERITITYWINTVNDVPYDDQKELVDLLFVEATEYRTPIRLIVDMLHKRQ